MPPTMARPSSASSTISPQKTSTSPAIFAYVVQAIQSTSCRKHLYTAAA
ncbi:hypothetical protein PSPO01_14566 [Paraphaeosphaeria sporulosa]